MSWISASRFFEDCPWSRVPSTRQANILIEPLFPKGGLVGGSSTGKMSKLQRLAAERLRRSNERASFDEGFQSTGGRSSSLAESLEKLRRPARASKSEGSGAPTSLQDINEIQADPPPTSTAVVDPAAPRREEKVLQSLEQLKAAPSPFAITLLGLSQERPSSTRGTPGHHADDVRYMLYPTETDFSAFLGPSPDDIVMAAQQSKGG